MSGFGSAFDDLAAALGGGGDSVVVLPIDQVTEDPANPRSTFDDADIAALAETVKGRGVLQPITVGPAASNGKYPLRFGARRLRAAKLAGLTEIRALVRAGTVDEAEIVVEQVIENDQRSGLTTGDMANAVARLLKLGKTQAEVGRLLGRPKDQIAMLAAVAKRSPALLALGDSVGLRTLYELQGAWKQDAAAVERWLEGRDPASILQSDARALAARLTSKPRGGAAKAPNTDRPERSTPATAHRQAPAAGAARLGVAVGRRRGQLILDHAADAEGHVLVRFEGVDAPERVALDRIRLVSLDVD